MSNQTNTPGWCNGSTSDSGSFGLGSSPSPGARWRYGQAAKTSPSQGEIKGSIPFSATTKLTLILRYQRFFVCKCKFPNPKYRHRNSLCLHMKDKQHLCCNLSFAGRLFFRKILRHHHEKVSCFFVPRAFNIPAICPIP